MPNTTDSLPPALVRVPIPIPMSLWDRLEELAAHWCVPMQELCGYLIALQMTGHSLDELCDFVQRAKDLGVSVFTQLLEHDQYPGVPDGSD